MREPLRLGIPPAHRSELLARLRTMPSADQLILSWLEIGQEGLRPLHRRGPRVYARPVLCLISVLPTTKAALRSAATAAGGSVNDIIRYHLERLAPELRPSVDYAAVESRQVALSLSSWRKLRLLADQLGKSDDEMIDMLIYRQIPRHTRAGAEE